VPINKVAVEVQCEIKDFLKTPDAGLLDPDEAASLTLIMTTDTSGSVAYIGIDLKKIGLGALADFVASSNKVPSLQAKAQAKSTVNSQIDFTVPQSLHSHRTKAKYALNPANGRVEPLSKPIKGLEHVKCDNHASRLIVPLDLKSWFVRFFERVRRDEIDPGAACLTKITLKTQFQLLFDINGGMTPFFGNAFILPISGLNGDFSPAFTHSLQITFAIKPNPKQGLCAVPGPQPNRSIAASTP
jgi:hypothetical protein